MQYFISWNTFVCNHTLLDDGLVLDRNGYGSPLILRCNVGWMSIQDRAGVDARDVRRGRTPKLITLARCNTEDLCGRNKAEPVPSTMRHFFYWSSRTSIPRNVPAW
jgi:hypothetical protein